MSNIDIPNNQERDELVPSNSQQDYINSVLNDPIINQPGREDIVESIIEGIKTGKDKSGEPIENIKKWIDIAREAAKEIVPEEGVSANLNKIHKELEEGRSE